MENEIIRLHLSGDIWHDLDLLDDGDSLKNDYIAELKRRGFKLDQGNYRQSGKSQHDFELLERHRKIDQAVSTIYMAANDIAEVSAAANVLGLLGLRDRLRLRFSQISESIGMIENEVYQR